MALLETKDLGITFDGLVALEGVNFAAEAGSSHRPQRCRQDNLL